MERLLDRLGAGRAVAWLRGRRLRVVVAVCAAAGLFLGGVATGWWAADRFSPRSAPELVVVAAPPAPDPGEEAAVTMPDLRGLTESEARQVLHDVGLAGVVVTVDSRPAVGAVGTVVAQEPVASAPVGGSVTLTLAAPAVVPEVVGAGVIEALRQLEALGARVQVDRVFQDGAEVDRVLGVHPVAGEPVGELVVLTVATPPSGVLLSELSPLEGGCRTVSGVQVGGQSYDEALRCGPSSDSEGTAYLLNGGVADFTATVGQADESPPGTQARLEVLVDGVVEFSEVFEWGDSRQVTVATGGALRLTLRVSLVAESDGDGPALVLAEATLRGGPAEIDALRAGA